MRLTRIKLHVPKGHKARATRKWLRSKLINLLEECNLCPDLNPIGSLCQYWKIAAQTLSLFNCAELELFAKK